MMTVEYRSNGGDSIFLREGKICTDMSTCLDGWVSTVGPALFGGLAGTLHVVNPTPVYGIFVSPHTAPAYAIYGTGMSQAQFVQIAASLVKVPDPAP
jgi:hypothetical protein